MHLLLALLRHIHREIYVLGWSFVPIALNKYRSECAIAIGLLCAVVALYDVTRRRWAQATLWIASGALLYAGFHADAMLWSPRTSIVLGSAAIAAAVLAVLLNAREMLQKAIAQARRERHALRRVPGVPVQPRSPVQSRPPAAPGRR
jgi:hypothetical protein